MSHEREDLYLTIDSAGWSIFIEEMTERVASMIGPLTGDPDLPEAERRGYVYAIRHIQGGVRAVYEKAGREIPPRVKQGLGMKQ